MPENPVTPVRQVSRKNHAEEKSSGGLPTRVVAARLIRLKDDAPKTLTPAQIVHAVHTPTLRATPLGLRHGAASHVTLIRVGYGLLRTTVLY